MDLKLDNIALSQNFEIKLIDFGKSVTKKNQEKLNNIYGT